MKPPSEGLLPTLQSSQPSPSITPIRLGPKWLPPTFIIVLLFFLFTTPSNQLHALTGFAPAINLQHPSTSPPNTNLQDPSRFTPAQHTLLQYAKWHTQQRLCLTNSSCTNPPLLIWQCPEDNAMKCAGVGDRFRGIAFSLMLAVATRRLLLIDWNPFPYPLEHAVLPASFNWTIPKSLKPSSFPVLNWFYCVPVRPCYKSGHSPLITNLPPPNATEPDLNFIEDDIMTRLDKYPNITIWSRMPLSTLRHFQQNSHLVPLMPTIQDTDSVELQKAIFELLFRFSPSVENMTHNVALRKSEIYDGLHVRTGADVGETGRERFKVINQDMNATVSRILSCVKKRSVQTRRIYLASDSSKFKTVFRERAKEDGIDVLCLEQRAIHLGYSKQVTQNMKQRERRLSFLTVFADLLLLSRAKRIFTSGSGFANTAFCLGNASSLLSLRENCPL